MEGNYNNYFKICGTFDGMINGCRLPYVVLKVFQFCIYVGRKR